MMRLIRYCWQLIFIVICLLISRRLIGLFVFYFVFMGRSMNWFLFELCIIFFLLGLRRGSESVVIVLKTLSLSFLVY